MTENAHVSRPEPKIIQSPAKQERSQNLKQLPQNFMEVFNFDDVIQLRHDPEKPTLLKKK